MTWLLVQTSRRFPGLSRCYTNAWKKEDTNTDGKNSDKFKAVHVC